MLDQKLFVNKTRIYWTATLFVVLCALTACKVQSTNEAFNHSSNIDKLNVVATTTIVGDVVAQVGGGQINLDILLPAGTDPHSFDPTPQDIAKISDAELIFANGGGLEDFLDDLIDSAGAEYKVIHVSDGIDFLIFEGEEHEGENQEIDDGLDHTGADPHTWTDPNNVIVWVNNIEQKLIELDPENAETYEAHATSYIAELEALDAWIRQQVALIPEANRKIVTDHALFGYFTKQYGFEQIGALIPSNSTLAEPTAQELAKIEDAIHDLDIPALFVGNSVNPSLAERVAEDTGIALVFIYTGSLSEAEGEAGTYLDYMRYNTNAFVGALK
jgi:ABC-type Zn uptake system ZnuABC Zn-binding protein ZnuA